MRELPRRQNLGGPAGWLAWLRQRLLPGGTDNLMIAAYTILLTALISFILSAHRIAPGAYYTTIVCLSAMFVLQVFFRDLQDRLGEPRAGWLLLGVSAALYLLASYFGLRAEGVSFLPFVLFMLTAQAMVVLPWWPAAAYVGLLTLGWLGALALLGASLGDLLVNLVSIGLGQIFTVTFARVLVLFQQQTARAQALAAELQAANQALASAAERERELSAAEERLRLARDIHDGLGHHLTVLNVQLQAAARLVERDPPRAAQVLAICRDEAQAAMAEVRQSVAAMRHSPLDGRPLEEAIAALVAEFDRASPLDVTFRREGEPAELTQAAALTLYRAAQEGLTNAQKHALAGRVAVTLAFAPGAAALRVRDDGAGAAASGACGFGLAGLRERAAQLGGTLSAGPRPDGGFLLEVEVPL